MASPKATKRTDPNKPQPAAEDRDETTEADIVAESIEAGYDIQSNAATKSLADDPASSSEHEDIP